MKKRLTLFVLVLALSFSLSVSASAADDMQYYSLPSVASGEPSLVLDWPVNSAEFDNNDSTTLTNIYKYIQYLTLSPASWQRNSIVGFLDRILDSIPSNLDTNFALVGGDGTNSILYDVRKWTMFSYNYLSSDNIAGNLGNIQRNTLNTNDAVLKGNTVLSAISDMVATETTLSAFSSAFSSFKGMWQYMFNDQTWAVAINSDGSVEYTYFQSYLRNALRELVYDTQLNYPDKLTLRGMVMRLQETLASDDDVELAKNQKQNREQIEQDFLSGSSGKTSLGKGDFSNASQVGGALNDTFNMGGAAKVSDFLSGFGSAGTDSQAWFSQTTSNNLNAVESGDGTQGVSTFSDDGESMVDVDPDPYNMANIFERYDWLEGVNVDD